MASYIFFTYRHQPIAFSTPAYHLHAPEVYLTPSEIRQQIIKKEKREKLIAAKVEANKESKQGKCDGRKEVLGRDDVARLMRKLRVEGDESL